MALACAAGTGFPVGKQRKDGTGNGAVHGAEFEPSRRKRAVRGPEPAGADTCVVTAERRVSLPLPMAAGRILFFPGRSRVM